jgi:SP family general alpha glucoside:H+ symporter-like MFS transporter
MPYAQPRLVELVQLDRFLLADICVLCIVYTYYRVPEPQGRSFAELDLLLKRSVGARKFATTKADVFGENMEGGLVHEYERIGTPG